jgi:hypothetical protein
MLDCAIDAYDNAGYLDYLIRGLCERSQVYGVRGRPGDWSAALSDLKRAERLGGNNQAMSLLMADVHLCRVRVLVGVWPSLSERERSDWRGQLSAAFADAAGRIERHHYGRRDGELQALELELRLTGVQ